MMIKAYALRFHRWLALLFALPLLVIIVTGTILSFEPLTQRAALDRPLTGQAVLDYLAKFDTDGKATGLTLRPYEQTLTVAGVGEDGEIEINLKTGTLNEEDEGLTLSDVFGTARGLHEHLLFGLEWLVIPSTVAMLLLVVLGLAMGWPRLRNSLGGWHSVSAWTILPLAILSPLTGLALALGITFTAPPSGPRVPAMPIREAVALVGERHDLANLTSLRPRGGRLMARIHVDGALKGYAVSKAGLAELPANWPRALHEGNWHTLVGPALNIIASVVFCGLWLTGLIIWTRRTLRQKRHRQDSLAARTAGQT
jgi:uncharacterized iron-regulated membrane protein